MVQKMEMGATAAVLLFHAHMSNIVKHSMGLAHFTDQLGWLKRGHCRETYMERAGV